MCIFIEMGLELVNLLTENQEYWANLTEVQVTVTKKIKIATTTTTTLTQITMVWKVMSRSH